MGTMVSRRPLRESRGKSTSKTQSSENTVPRDTDWTERYDREFKAIDNPNYMLPGDGHEVYRLQIQHCCVRAMFNGNFNAPIRELLESGINVLDVGSGPGTWTMEMAKEFPRSTFHAIDIADVFCKTDVPSNCSFTVANTPKHLPFQDGHFDFIFQRCMVLSYTEREWKLAMNELLRVLKPGGTIELVESDLRICDAGPITATWNKSLHKVMKERGFSARLARYLPDLLLNHGLDAVHGDHRSCPMNWLGRLGQLMYEDMELSFEVLKAPILRAGHYSDADAYDKAITTARTEFQAHKSWVNFYMAYGRKPLEVRAVPEE